MESQRGTEIKVGLFVIVALAAAGVLVFFIGSANQMFDRQVSLYSWFRSVSGLKVGAQVQLSGLKIGVVDRIWIGSPKANNLTLPPLPEKSGKPAGATIQGAKKSQKKAVVDPDNNPARSYILVRMKVDASKLEHIHVLDSVATIKGKGLLGDSLLEITMGSRGAEIKAGGVVRGETPRSLNDMIGEVTKISELARESLKSVRNILRQYEDPALSNNLKGIVGSIHNVLARVKTGPGLLHDLFFSRRLIRNVQGVVGQARGSMVSLRRSVQKIDRLLYRAQRPGTLVHGLLLSRKSGKLVKNIEGTVAAARVAVRGLASILKAPQRKGTLLNKLLYSKETSRLVTNVVKSTDYLRTIMRDIRRGKGTLGAIINDPTAFEDFKTILGQVKRSRIFKTLIRFIIKRDDSTKGGGLQRVKFMNRKR